MSSTLVRSMHPSQQTVPSSNSPAGTPRVAPYLTHLTTHHGQLTLIPPQNAGRIRKAMKKRTPEKSKQDRRNANEEPRFTTSVPPSSSRRLHPASSPTRTRKHTTVPQTPRTCDPRLDEFPVPDYPPPSFQEAISSPSPYFLAPPTSEHAVDAPPMILQANSPQPFPYTQAGSLAPLSRTLQDSPPQSPLSLTPPRAEPQPNIAPATRDPDSDSDDSSLEIVSFDPYADDCSLDANVHNTAQRERTRRQAATSTTTFTRSPKPSFLPYTHMHTTPISRLRSCSHCGSVRPLDGDVHDSIDSDEERDEVTLDGPPGGLPARAKYHQICNAADTASAPSSPSSASPTTFVNMSSPWASSITLSLGNVFSVPKPNQTSSSAVNLKKKEMSGIRRLFVVKGKEREAQDRPNDNIDSWEMIEPTAVGPDDQNEYSNQGQKNSALQEQNKGNTSAPPLLAFVNRPVRRHGPTQVFPFPPAASLPPPPPPPEKTPLPVALSSESQPRKTRRPAPPPPLRKVGQSTPSPPSVKWKPNVNVEQLPVSPSPFVPISTDTMVSSHEQLLPPSPLPSPGTQGRVVPSTPGRTSSPVWQPTTEHKPPSDAEFSTADSYHHGVSSLVVPVVPSAKWANPLTCQTESAPAGIISIPSATPSTPTTPTSVSGHHYPGRPLPRPPHSSTPSISKPIAMVDVLPHSGHIASTTTTNSDNPVHVLVAEQGPRHHESTRTLSSDDHALDNDSNDGDEDFAVLPSAGFVQSYTRSSPSPSSAVVMIGRIELDRRRVLKDGRAKLKLSLLGIGVDKCGICLSQFKEAELAALGPDCQHSFHDRCLRRWLAQKHTCPLCRAALTMDDLPFP